MLGISKSEAEINNDTSETESGIEKIKNGPPRGNLLRILMNPVKSLLVIVLGGLILITLARKAMNAWKEAYMPKTDKSQMVIFGVKIPKWAEIKAFAIGVRNFVVVGLPNWYRRLSLFIGDMKKKLFGKKGLFRSVEYVKYMLKRIFTALIISWTNKAVGTVFTWLGEILNFIPVIGPVLRWICKIIPYVIRYITNKIAELMGKYQMNKEMQLKAGMVA